MSAQLLHEAWLRRLRALYYTTSSVSPRGQATREILDAHLRFDAQFNLLACPGRGLNYRFAVAEWLWMSFGRSDVSSLAQYNKVIAQFSDDGVFLTGAYGPHIRAQWQRTVDRLTADPDTRQAVIEIPRPRGATKDEPCTLSLQFLLRGGKLNLIATMRSSDVWLGVPYDLFSFTQLQNALAGQLGVGRGWCALNTGSSHLYERDVDKAAPLVRVDVSEPAASSLYLPDLPGRPPDWLEDVLVHREDAVNGKRLALPIPDGPWARYARALLAPTSVAAFDALTAT
jgi:thymidylate synthase